jgi:hypothetical protein
MWAGIFVACALSAFAFALGLASAKTPLKARSFSNGGGIGRQAIQG